MFILNGLTPLLVVTVHSKEFTGRTSVIAQSIDGSLVAGLGRSVLRPYVCLKRIHLRAHEGTRSLDLDAKISTGL